MRAGIGDDRAHHPADERADGQRRQDAEHECQDGPASAPPCMWRIQAMVKPLRLAVKVTARLKPPEMIGISIASVSRPSSGSWKATESNVR